MRGEKMRGEKRREEEGREEKRREEKRREEKASGWHSHSRSQCFKSGERPYRSRPFVVLLSSSHRFPTDFTNKGASSINNYTFIISASRAINYNEERLTCSTQENMRNEYKILVGKPQGKRTLLRVLDVHMG
jgi:hypothetical protein